MEKVRTFNFINSIKGGCGKTTFSVFLAKYLDSQQNSEGIPLILDMDLQGTAMQYLFEGNDTTNQYTGNYLNDAVRKSNNYSKYIRKNVLKDGTKIDTIFANPIGKEKLKYRVSAQVGYSLGVKLNVFRDGLNVFLRKFENAPYNHFIFDMPPNSDGFSDAAMECILNRHYSVAKKDDKVNLFYVLGVDGAHTKATIEEIKNFLERTDYKDFDNLFIVFNDNVNRFHEGTQEYEEIIGNQREAVIWNQKVERFRNALKNLEQEKLEKIHFAMMANHPAYATWCITGRGLCSKDFKSSILPKYPFELFVEFLGTELEACSSDLLLNLLLRKEIDVS